MGTRQQWSTTRESTKLYNEARRAMRAGSPAAANEIGKEAGKKALEESRDPIRSHEQLMARLDAKDAMKAQADAAVAQKVREAPFYNAAGYVKPTEGSNTALGQRQAFFNEMVNQARTDTLDLNKSRTESNKRGLNLSDREWFSGVDRLPATSNLGGSAAATTPTPATPTPATPTPATPATPTPATPATPTPATPTPTPATPTPATPEPTLATPTPTPAPTRTTTGIGSLPQEATVSTTPMGKGTGTGIGSLPQERTKPTLVNDPTAIDTKNKTSSVTGRDIRSMVNPYGRMNGLRSLITT